MNRRDFLKGCLGGAAALVAGSTILAQEPAPEPFSAVRGLPVTLTWPDGSGALSGGMSRFRYTQPFNRYVTEHGHLDLPAGVPSGELALEELYGPKAHVEAFCREYGNLADLPNYLTLLGPAGLPVQLHGAVLTQFWGPSALSRNADPILSLFRLRLIFCNATFRRRDGVLLPLEVEKVVSFRHLR